MFLRIAMVMFLSFGLLSACAPKCPKPTTPLPSCKPKKKEVKKNVSKAYYINWVKRKTFGIWISAWGANPRCTPPYIHMMHPGDITISCRFPGREAFEYSFQIPDAMEVEGQCPVSHMVPVELIKYAHVFGKWVRAFARRSRLVVRYHKGVPWLITTDLTKEYRARFPISNKRAECLRVAYNAHMAKKQMTASRASL